jgi:Rrf2 family iron-sulfur cluster assembly transcriptional regulator
MNAVDEVLDATKSKQAASRHNGKKGSTHDLWHELNVLVEDYLEKITIHSLVETDNSPYIKVKEIN